MPAIWSCVAKNCLRTKCVRFNHKNGNWRMQRKIDCFDVVQQAFSEIDIFIITAASGVLLISAHF